MFKAVPDYSLYVGHLKADEIETKKKADLDAIALILYKTEMYSTTITNATDLVTKLTESYANVNHAEYNKVFNYVVDSINAVPVYSNYFEAGLLDNASVKKVYDADADKLGLYKTTMDEYVLLFNTYQTAYKTVSEFTHLGTKETINDIETTAYEVYLARLDAYVNKDNVVAAIKDMTAKQITEFATKAKAEVATIVTSAQTLDEINEYLYDETDGKIAIITNLKNLDDELKQKFIDKISLYATYVNHISLTSTFTTETQFTKYLSDAKTKAESTGTIATSEDSNVYEVNQAITTITTNYTTEKISEELKDYLLAVVANIYENNTNVDITSVIVATSRQNTLKSQIDAVTASINTFINVDTAISKLDSDMYEFVFAARSEFITNHTDSATATKIFDSHAEEIEAKEDEIMYTYIIPESFTYADFATFRDSLKTTGQINDLIKTFQAWYVNELLETMEAEYTEATTPATEDPAE